MKSLLHVTTEAGGLCVLSAREGGGLDVRDVMARKVLLKIQGAPNSEGG